FLPLEPNQQPLLMKNKGHSSKMSNVVHHLQPLPQSIACSQSSPSRCKSFKRLL
ncbi:hypothetical protein NDU88_000654, partial [Pleurodeles waltl]